MDSAAGARRAPAHCRSSPSAPPRASSPLGGECAVSVAQFSALAAPLRRRPGGRVDRLPPGHRHAGQPVPRLPHHGRRRAHRPRQPRHPRAPAGHGRPRPRRPGRAARADRRRHRQRRRPGHPDLRSRRPALLDPAPAGLAGGHRAAHGCRSTSTSTPSKSSSGWAPFPAGLTGAQVRRVVTDLSAAADIVALTIAEFFPRQVMHLRQILDGFRLITRPARGEQTSAVGGMCRP
jgi:hypothetical protein